MAQSQVIDGVPGASGKSAPGVTAGGVAATLRLEGGAVLAAGATELDSLCARTVRLPVPILLRCADPALAAEALAHGADGIAYPADLMTPAEFKARLAGAGVPLRR